MIELRRDSDDGDQLRFTASGRITQAELGAEGDPLAQQGGDDVYSRPLLLSLEAAEFLDSSGVGWLLSCHKRFRESGGALVIHSIPPLIAKTLQVLRMNLVLHLADGIEEATQIAQEQIHERK